MLSSLKFKLPNKLYGQLLTAIIQYINILPNSVHPTLTPPIIFKEHKFDISVQAPVPFGTFAALHYAKRVTNKYEPHTENGLLLYLADNVTHNVIAWIPGRNTVATINKYTIIKASSSDFGLQDNKNIIRSHIPDFLTISSSPHEGATVKANPNLQNQKLCSISPLAENEKNSKDLDSSSSSSIPVDIDLYKHKKTSVNHTGRKNLFLLMIGQLT